MNEMYIDRLINESIKDLADGDYKRSAENLAEFAGMWAKAGLPLSSFQELRGYIVQESQLKNPLCRMHLEAAEKDLQITRVLSNGYSTRH
jgi:hypothetical protein